jgi:outer membrane protein assembly factor BamB
MKTLLAMLALALLSPPPAPTAAPFGWRGDGSGRFPDAAPPTEWAPARNVRWCATVGKGYASPIVVGDRVVVASEPGVLLGLDRADGKEKWRIAVGPGDLADPAARAIAQEYQAKDTGLAAATPVSDGTTIYAVFANGILRAVDLEGRPRWTAFIDARQNTAYGRSASPILVGGRLIVHMTHLYAFDAASGKLLWVNQESRCAYGTPARLRQGGVDLLCTPAGDVVRADDGKNLNVQIGACSNSSPLAQDGVLYFGEKDVRAIRLGAEFKDESVWNAEIAGEVFGSPILHEGLLFTVTGKGELYVFDASKKGSAEPLVDARPLFGDDVGAQPVVYASLALAGKHLYLTSLLGVTLVMEATREAKIVARNTLKDGTGASPVFSGKELFLRDGDRLYCIGEPR